MYVYNKCDLLETVPAGSEEAHRVYVSAKSGRGMDTLLTLLRDLVLAGHRRVTLCFPYSEQGKMSRLYECGTVEDVRYEENGVTVDAVLDGRGCGLFRRYIISGLPQNEEEDYG